MNLDLTRADMKLLDVVLSKELGETRLEIRHSDNLEYKNCLKDREKRIDELIAKLETGINAAA